MKLYTCRIDYFATGEGRKIWTALLWAENEEKAKEAFRKSFPEFKDDGWWDHFSIGLEIAEGVEKAFLPDFRVGYVSWLKQNIGCGPVLKYSFDINCS